MPLINHHIPDIPNNSNDNDEYNSQEDLIGQALIEGGLAPEKLGKIINENNKLRRTLDQAGASVENATRTIAGVMQNAKYENNRLRAAELALDLHGVRDKDGSVRKQPIFQFLIKDSSININNIFAPIRPDSLTEISPNEDYLDIPTSG